MERFRVVVAGGGVAGLEGLLRLRRLLGDAAEIALIAPNEEFAFRALSVKEPFALGGSPRYPIGPIARAAGADWLRDSLEWVDLDGQVVHTAAGEQRDYDALLLAIGARVAPAFEHVTTFRDDQADALFGGIVQDVEDGYTKSVAFVVPDGPVWLLPLYELALMTAVRAKTMGMDDVELTLVTPEVAPLDRFGAAASEAVGRLLDDAGIAVDLQAVAHVPAAGRLVVQPQGVELEPDRIVALPAIAGPSIRGIPGAGATGFIPIDAHCAVPGTNERVFAAGDATAFPIKHGGLGAQQADTAAAAIAWLAGVEGEAPRFLPTIRGMLLTGAAPLYMSAQVVGGQGFRSEVSREPLWDEGEKVAAEELSAYLGAA